MHVLKLVPTVLGNGQNEGNHEHGYTFKYFRVPTLLSTLQNATLSKYTKFFIFTLANISPLEKGL